MKMVRRSLTQRPVPLADTKTRAEGTADKTEDRAQG